MTPKHFLILCEGGTEEKYFTDLVGHLNDKGHLFDVLMEIYQPKDHSPRGLLTEARRRIKKAKEEEKTIDYIWLVFDKDDHPGIASTFGEAAIFKGLPEIKIGFSACCFEFYILLHFERTTKPFTKCNEVVRHLKKFLPEYEKSGNLYQELYRYRYVAKENCEFVIKQVQNDLDRGTMPYELDTYCNIHELVAFLEGLP